jgi:hypothetical protein
MPAPSGQWLAVAVVERTIYLPMSVHIIDMTGAVSNPPLGSNGFVQAGRDPHENGPRRIVGGASGRTEGRRR